MPKIAAVLISFLIITLLSCAENRTGITEHVYNESVDKDVIVLKSLTIKEGRLSFLTDTNGCTNKESFKVDTTYVKKNAQNSDEYALTIRRTVPDRCKAFIIEGIVIEYDLNKDLGIKNNSVVSVKNMVQSN